MALDACIQTEFGEEQFEVCRFEEEEQQQQIPDVFSLSLSLSLSRFFSSGCFFFCKLGCKTSWSFFDSHSNSNTAAYLLGGGALICDFFLL
jgi:hypothetical protein